MAGQLVATRGADVVCINGDRFAVLAKPALFTTPHAVKLRKHLSFSFSSISLVGMFTFFFMRLKLGYKTVLVEKEASQDLDLGQVVRKRLRTQAWGLRTLFWAFVENKR